MKWGAEVGQCQIYQIIKKIVENPENMPLTITESNICLLHKKGDKLNPKNYRPIALRHFLMNVLDKWIYSRIRSYIRLEEE